METTRLRNIDLFARLSDEELERLAGSAQEASIDEGTALIKRGTWSYQLFAIEEGSVEVRRKGQRVATLRAGDVVGETGAVERALRNATVVAVSPLRVIYFTQADIGRFAKEIPDLDERLAAILRERSG